MFTSHLLASLRKGAAGLLVGAAALGSAQAAVITVSASQASVQTGDSFSLFFDISGLSTTSLGAFDLDVDFDGAVLELTGYSFEDSGTGLNQLDLAGADNLGFFGDAVVVGGVVDAYASSGNSQLRLDAEQAENFRFLTLTFTALAQSAGTTLSVNLTDPNLIFFGSGLDNLVYSFNTSAATVAITNSNGGGTVPEPGSLSLGLLALAGVALAGQRRRDAARRPVSAIAH